MSLPRIQRRARLRVYMVRFVKLKYRSEIDGLRAVAVSVVMFFHAGITGFSGGFVGVDIFFVISGYLITTVLIDDLENNRFSLFSFYERRARRILPALFLVSVICIPLALIWMLPHQLMDFSKSLIAVSLFLSNVLFWRQDDYFAAASDEKPLLHTWSLAIEEQYYLLFPICLMLLWRYGKAKIGIVFAALILVSLLISEWGWRNYSSANFYLAPSRIWELLCGSLVAIFINRNGAKVSNVVSLVGLAMILIAVFLYSNDTPHPSIYTLIPVLGTALVLMYGNRGSLVATLLYFPPLVGLGLISYSAYLWHQPLFAFARLASLNHPPDLTMLALIIISIALAFLSWKYVEQPFRNKYVVSRAGVVIFSLVGVSVLLLTGVLGLATNGLSSIRFDADELSRYDKSTLKSYEKNFLGDKNVDPTWMVLGDSHANSFQSALDKLFSEYSKSAVVETINGCPPARNLWRLDKNFGNRCDDKFAKALTRIDDLGITSIFISARYALYLNSDRFNNEEGGIEFGSTPRVMFDQIQYRPAHRDDVARHQAIMQEMINFVTTLSVRGISVYVVESIPEVGWHVPKALFLSGNSGKDISTSLQVHKQRVMVLLPFYERLRELGNVTLLNTSEVFCDRLRCKASQNRVPLYYDSNHPSVFGAELLINSFAEKMFISKGAL
jgi:peptidoglycan/LPS O-acetylase OafA/YrhL